MEESDVPNSRASAHTILKHALPSEGIQSYLRFQTEVKRGDSHNHIVNRSVFPVETRYHIIENGESLCGRRKMNFTSTRGDVTCEGCLAIAKSVAARDLLTLI